MHVFKSFQNNILSIFRLSPAIFERNYVFMLTIITYCDTAHRYPFEKACEIIHFHEPVHVYYRTMYFQIKGSMRPAFIPFHIPNILWHGTLIKLYKNAFAILNSLPFYSFSLPESVQLEVQNASQVGSRVQESDCVWRSWEATRGREPGEQTKEQDVQGNRRTRQVWLQIVFKIEGCILNSWVSIIRGHVFFENNSYLETSNI